MTYNSCLHAKLRKIELCLLRELRITFQMRLFCVYALQCLLHSYSLYDSANFRQSQIHAVLWLILPGGQRHILLLTNNMAPQGATSTRWIAWPKAGRGTDQFKKKKRLLLCLTGYAKFF